MSKIDIKLNKYLIALGIAIITIGTMWVANCILPRNNELVKEVEAVVNERMASNTYIQVHTNETDVVAFLFNKNKEAFAQTKGGGLAVYRNDDKYVSFGDTVNIEYGVSPLRIIDLALDLVKSGKAEITRPDNKETEDIAKLKTYLITIKGKDKVKELYSQVNTEYAEKMIDELYGSIYPKDSELQISVMVGYNGELGASCHMVLDGDRYLSWYFDGYLPMIDWEITKEWYSLDASDITKWKKLINSLVDSIETKTQKFAEDNSLDLTETTGEDTK